MVFITFSRSYSLSRSRSNTENRNRMNIVRSVLALDIEQAYLSLSIRHGFSTINMDFIVLQWNT
jgi:hypothetical protein